MSAVEVGSTVEEDSSEWCRSTGRGKSLVEVSPAQSSVSSWQHDTLLPTICDVDNALTECRLELRKTLRVFEHRREYARDQQNSQRHIYDCAYREMTACSTGAYYDHAPTELVRCAFRAKNLGESNRLKSWLRYLGSDILTGLRLA